ncbi:hypothetical protein GO988_04605 [Hymenobacter sp. HMF4947]|uniref:Uncharacterized protein n=1 Tax=Hymenobacter ginkgonis TaxID=2682976 RepID=A0A7K1TB20_9BACT|nr:hypothetical protein [Hymenobacter ginkgonis]MVN75600.1 hypothetical protein [Hymenobacter ginkgonis]
MSLLDLTDPNDSSVRGGLSNPDPISWSDVLAGSFLNLTIDEFTSSEDVATLFDLSAPPSFSGPYLVWGELAQDTGTLALYLATSTGDRDQPFAQLDGFTSAIDGSGGAASGSGSLSRSNKLPPAISWALNP